MMMRMISFMMLCALALTFSGLAEGKAPQEDNADTLYQVALLQSLTQGYYDGIIPVGELKRHGDIGIDV